jgi:hypothetical protein
MADPPQLRDVGSQHPEDRIQIGRYLHFEDRFPFPVNHTKRSLFHRNVQSGNGCPPLALGALTRPRLSTAILEERDWYNK